MFKGSSSVVETVRTNIGHVKNDTSLFPGIFVEASTNRDILVEFLTGKDQDQVTAVKFIYGKAFDVLMIVLQLGNGKRIGIKLKLTNLDLYETIAGIFITKKLVIQEEGDPGNHKYFLELKDAAAHIDEVWEHSVKKEMVANYLLPQLKKQYPDNKWTKFKVLEMLNNNPSEINNFEKKCKEVWSQAV